MTINEIKLKIKDLIKDYHEDEKTSRVSAWGGKLDVRPEFQREFIYKDEQRDAVIKTILNNFPLNITYFVDRGDGSYEVLDGQQRIISICRYAQNAFSVDLPELNSINFPNLFEDYKNIFLNYELSVYICQGTEKEKFEWFKIINIAGETLEEQEILNALYHGAWLTDAKNLFSRRNCAAYKLYGKYMAGECIRQKYLESVFKWRAQAENFTGKNCVADFMQAHRFDKDAGDLWKYFEDVFKWVKKNFGNDIDKSMQGVAWGELYNSHKDDNLEPEYLQRRVKELLADDDVTKKSGIYRYLLENESVKAEKYLSIRAFTKTQVMTVYNKQGRRCALCKKIFDISEMHGDHIKPWSQGGRTLIENCQVLCSSCNLKKGGN